MPSKQQISGCPKLTLEFMVRPSPLHIAGGTPAPQIESRQSPRRPRRRDGIVLIAALICLMVSSLTVANIFKTVRVQRRQVARRTVELQSALLAHAGMRRAIAKLSANSAYKGELWQPQIPLTRTSTDGGQESTTGRVQITVEPSDKQMVRLAVIAEYPFGTADQTRKSITWSIPARSTNDNTNFNTVGDRR